MHGGCEDNLGRTGSDNLIREREGLEGTAKHEALRHRHPFPVLFYRLSPVPLGNTIRVRTINVIWDPSL